MRLRRLLTFAAPLLLLVVMGCAETITYSTEPAPVRVVRSNPDYVVGTERVSTLYGVVCREYYASGRYVDRQCPRSYPSYPRTTGVVMETTIYGGLSVGTPPYGYYRPRPSVIVIRDDDRHHHRGHGWKRGRDWDRGGHRGRDLEDQFRREAWQECRRHSRDKKHC